MATAVRESGGDRCRARPDHPTAQLLGHRCPILLAQAPLPRAASTAANAASTDRQTKANSVPPKMTDDVIGHDCFDARSRGRPTF